MARRIRGNGGGEQGDPEREEAGMVIPIEHLCVCNPNQWLISTSLATNIYLRVFTEGSAVQLDSPKYGGCEALTDVCGIVQSHPTAVL